MSDTHAWSGEDATRQVITDLRACEARVRVLVHGRDRDDPDRAGLVELWGDLSRVADQLEQLVPQPVALVKHRLSQRQVGEDTGAWLAGTTKFMPRNRGPR